MGRRRKNRNSEKWRKINEAFGLVKDYGEGLVSGNTWSVRSGEVDGENINTNSRSLKLNKYVGYLIQSKGVKW